MHSLRFFMFWILVPVILILGHDLYLFSQKYPLESLPEILQNEEIPVSSHLSDLGFVWREYAPGSLKWVAQQLEESQRENFTNLLTQKAIIVFSVMAAVIYGFLFLLGWIFIGRLRMSDRVSGREHARELMGRTSDSRMRYNRK